MAARRSSDIPGKRGRPPRAATAAPPQTTPAVVDRRLFINSLEKGFAVLGAFDEVHRVCTIAEIATRTGLGRSATQRVAYTLEMLGYLRRDPVSRRLALTPKALTLAYGFLRSNSEAEASTRYLAEIARETEEAASLSELDGTDIVVVSRVPSQHLFTLNVVPGMRFPAYCSAPGRAMLSLLPEEAAAAIIDRSILRAVTRHTITDRVRLIQELERVRADGYAIAAEEIYAGSLSIAVPVPRPDGMPVASINVFCPTARWSMARARQVVVPLLLRAADDMRALYPAIASGR